MVRGVLAAGEVRYINICGERLCLRRDGANAAAARAGGGRTLSVYPLMTTPEWVAAMRPILRRTNERSGQQKGRQRSSNARARQRSGLLRPRGRGAGSATGLPYCTT